MLIPQIVDLLVTGDPSVRNAAKETTAKAPSHRGGYPYRGEPDCEEIAGHPRSEGAGVPVVVHGGGASVHSRAGQRAWSEVEEPRV